jgi:hypothetical protein
MPIFLDSFLGRPHSQQLVPRCNEVPTMPAPTIDQTRDIRALVTRLCERLGVKRGALCTGLGVSYATLTCAMNGYAFLPQEAHTALLLLDGDASHDAEFRAKANSMADVTKRMPTPKLGDKDDLNAFMRRWNLNDARMAVWMQEARQLTTEVRPKYVHNLRSGFVPVPNAVMQPILAFDGNPFNFQHHHEMRAQRTDRVRLNYASDLIVNEDTCRLHAQRSRAPEHAVDLECLYQIDVRVLKTALNPTLCKPFATPPRQHILHALRDYYIAALEGDPTRDAKRGALEFLLSPAKCACDLDVNYYHKGEPKSARWVDGENFWLPDQDDSEETSSEDLAA